jgi:hypothetical protein
VANFEGCNIHDNTAEWVFLHLELFLNLHPSPLWMELDLALAARRAVASLSVPTEWQTLKAAIYMTTLRQMCACPYGMLTVVGASWQDSVSFALN